MAEKTSTGLDITLNADGFDITGGTTPRTLTVSGGNASIVGGGSATITWPPVTSTISRTDSLAYDYVVYKSGGTTIAVRSSDSSNFSSNADASVVLQACVDAIDGSTNVGGRILVKPGTYDMSTMVTVAGDNTTDSKAVAIHGSGVQATIFKPSVNVSAFTFSNRVKFSFRDAAIIVRGSGSGIITTNSTTTQRACWLSEIKNVYVYDDGSSTAHSGWGFDLGNFFRSVVENVDMNQVLNGIRVSALGSSAFNPGDCTFTRIFIELKSGASSGVGFNLNSNVGGRVNQMNFSMCEIIGTGTGQTGILLDGTYGVNYTRWTGINVEEVDKVLDIQVGNGNTFDFNYIVTRDAVSTTYFTTASGAVSNTISCTYLDTYTRTVTIINDANTTYGQRNRFQNITLQGSSPTYNFTRVDATYLHNIFDNINGGLGVNINSSSSVSANAVTINATSGYFTDTTDINADTSRTAITLTNQAIRSTSIVNVWMASAPDANAMLIGSVVPSDGSASIVVRNCGTGNQTSTYTMAFQVIQ